MAKFQFEDVEVALVGVVSQSAKVFIQWQGAALSAISRDDTPGGIIVADHSLRARGNDFEAHQSDDHYYIRPDLTLCALLNEAEHFTSGDWSLVVRSVQGKRVVSFVFQPRAKDAELYELNVQYILDYSLLPIADKPDEYNTEFSSFAAALVGYNAVVGKV